MMLYTSMHNVHVGIVGLLYSDANSRKIDDRLSLIATFYTYTKHRINGLLSPFRITQDNLHDGQISTATCTVWVLELVHSAC